jgi:hypothetical protein
MKRENVDFVILLEGAQLHSGDYTNPQPLASFSRSSDSTNRIVVSERQRLEAATRGGFDYLFRWECAIGGGRVSMEVDERRPTRRRAHFA